MTQCNRGRRRCARRATSTVVAAAGMAATYIATAAPFAHAAESAWNVNADGDWGAAGNWNNGVPNAIGAQADFYSAINAPHTVNQNLSSVTVANIFFANSSRYTIGGNQIIIDQTSSQPLISTTAGAHTIATSLSLVDTPAFTGNPGTSLTLSGIILGSVGLQKLGGSSTLTMSGGQSNIYSGNTEVFSGTLRAAKTGGAKSIPGGTLFIGSQNINAPAGQVVFDGGGQLASPTSITINETGSLDGGNFFTLVNGAVTLHGATITNANLRITNNDITVSNTSVDPTTIDGAGLDFFGQTRTINVASGVVSPDLQIGAPIGGTGGINKIGDGTMLLTSASNTYSGITAVSAGVLELQCSITGTSLLNVTGTGKVVIDPLKTRVIKTPFLTMDGSVAKVDVKDNKLIIASGDKGSFNGTAYDGIAGFIASGYNNGAWDGGGIVTSQSAANNGNTLTSIGIATAGEAGYAGGAFAGVSVASGNVLVMYTYTGDANLDGVINGDDYFQIDSAFPQGLHDWFNGDFNYDGVINGDDYFLIDSNFPAQGAAFPVSDSLGRTAVPEPGFASAALLAAAWCSGTRRRRRV